MNHYFSTVDPDDWYDSIVRPHPGIDAAIQKGLAGNLWERDIVPILREWITAHNSRDLFCRSVGWSIQTVEFQKELAQLIGPGRRVLEVGAGRGVLGKVMPLRMGPGSSWICTDLDPPPGCRHVRKAHALWAVRRYRPDCVYVSWIPYRDDLDFRLAQLCAKRGIPLYVTGETYGGCCGSELLWYHRHRRYRIQHLHMQHDVPQWSGMHDQTVLVLPKGVRYVGPAQK